MRPLVYTDVLQIHYTTYIYIYIQSTTDKSDSQGTGKRVQLIEMSELSEIQNIMQINRATCSVRVTEMWNYAKINNINVVFNNITY